MKTVSLGGWLPSTVERGLFNWISVSDPGLSRLRTAARVTLAVVAAVLLSYLLVGQEALVAPIFGGIMGLMGSLVVNDPDPKQQKITTLLLIVPAALSVALGALLGSFPRLGDVVLVLLIFFAFYLRRFGPRFMALGMMAFMPFFMASIISSRPKISFGVAQLPWVVIALAIGVACVYLFRFVILRERPERVLRRITAAFHTQLGFTLESVIGVIEGERSAGRAEKKLRHDIERLYECATAAESQLSTPGFDKPEEHSDRLRFYLFDSEMSAHMLSEVAKRLVAPEREVPSEVRAALVHALRQLREPLSKGDRPVGHEPSLEALERLKRSRERLSGGKSGSWVYPVKRAEDAIHQLIEEAGAGREAQPSLEDEPEDDENDTGSGVGGFMERFQTTTLQGVQAALAGGLAIIAGHYLSPNRSYWVVIAAFIVFMRARSIGETLARGFSRTAGTLFGLIAGFVVATVTSGDLYLEVLLILVCIFVAFYLFSVSYSMLIFWITIALAIGYSLIGWLSGDLLALRFIDTLAGGAIGVAVSVLVFPAKTTDKVKDSAVDFLNTFKDYVCGRVHLLAGGDPAMRPVEKVRELDSKLWEVTQMSDTIRKQAAVFGRSRLDLDHLTTALMALDHYARYLAQPLRRGSLLDGDSPQSALLDEIGECIATNVDTLCNAISGGEEQKVQDVRTLLERLEQQLGASYYPSDEEPAEDLLRSLRCLGRIDHTLADIATEFGAPEDQS